MIDELFLVNRKRVGRMPSERGLRVFDYLKKIINRAKHTKRPTDNKRCVAH